MKERTGFRTGTLIIAVLLMLTIVGIPIAVIIFQLNTLIEQNIEINE